MEVVQLMSLLSLRPLINKLARTPGHERPEQVVALLTDLFQDAAAPMTRALRQANLRAWEVIEIALAGEGFWNGCQVFLSPEESEALRRQIGKIRAQTPLAGAEQTEGLRQLCVGELQKARKAGLLTNGEADLPGLLSRLRPLAHHEDPQRLPEIEWEAVHRLAGELRRAGLTGLAQFADSGRPESVPILIGAARYALCQEIAAAPELSRRLVWDAHCDLPGEQQEALALLTQTLVGHGRGLREWLEEDVPAPATPKEVHAHASSAKEQAAAPEAPARAPEGGWQHGTPAPTATSDPAQSAAATTSPPAEQAKAGQPLSRRQRLLGWLLPVLVLGLPILMVLWLLHHYAISEVRHFVGHKEVVTSVAFSPDGHHVLSGGGDETLRLWDVDTAKEVRQFDGHQGRVNGVAFSPDGKRILSGDMVSARLWDVDTGKQIRSLVWPPAAVLSVAYAPDGKHVLTTSKADSKVHLWDPETGKEVRVFEGHKGPVYSAVFSPDGKQIASGGDVTVRLWDVATAKELRKLEGHQQDVKAVAFSPNGRMIASGAADRKVLVWGVESDEKPAELLGAGGWVLAVAFTPDNSGVVAGCLGQSESAHEGGQQTLVQRRNLRWWAVRTRWEVCNFEDCEAPVWSVAFSPDGKYLLSGGANGAVRLWAVR